MQFTLFAVLMVLWLALSFHFSPLLIGLGVMSSALAAGFATRARKAMGGMTPALRSLALAKYLPFLGKEMLMAGLRVARWTLASPRSLARLESGFATFAAKPQSSLGRALLAQSITLTPGSASINVGDTFRVHLLENTAKSLAGCETLNQQVAALESPSS